MCQAQKKSSPWLEKINQKITYKSSLLSASPEFQGVEITVLSSTVDADLLLTSEWLGLFLSITLLDKTGVTVGVDTAAGLVDLTAWKNQ